jgi:hypothetical protein
MGALRTAADQALDRLGGSQTRATDSGFSSTSEKTQADTHAEVADSEQRQEPSQTVILISNICEHGAFPGEVETTTAHANT